MKIALRASRNKLEKTTGVLCFSTGWKDPVLWSHYADKHRGICLGFDVPDNLLRDVTYADEPIDVAPIPGTPKSGLSASDEERLLLTKFSGWKQESEQRQIVPLDSMTAESGLYFCPFSADLVLRMVILGPRCELAIDGVRRLVASTYPLAEVIKSRNAFGVFRVVVNNKATGHGNGDPPSAPD